MWICYILHITNCGFVEYEIASIWLNLIATPKGCYDFVMFQDSQKKTQKVTVLGILTLNEGLI
jgi:hypothetical protein